MRKLHPSLHAETLSKEWMELIVNLDNLGSMGIMFLARMGSGKTTLVNAILHTFAMLTPDDRVISIEDTTELQCHVSNYLDLRAVGNVSMLDCLRACMRLKPTRIVVGEVRGAEAHTLLKAWNTGHQGVPPLFTRTTR